MQQIAINLAISEDKNMGWIFSINGPPGTGKTTLIKEIVAENVVKRALLMCKYENPDCAFKQQEFKMPENEFLRYYYKPDKLLTKYGILIASNNNAAVENISMELPIAESVKSSNTSHFDIDCNEEIYFSGIANKLLSNKKCWGLISARLGKKSNINKFIDAIWFNNDINLKNYYKDSKPDWCSAKKEFMDKYSKVMDYREKIKDAVDATNEYYELKKECSKIRSKIDKVQRDSKEQENIYSLKVEEQKIIVDQIKMLTENYRLLKTRFPLFKRVFSFFFKNDPIVFQLTKLRGELNSAIIKRTDMDMKINNLVRDLHNLRRKYETDKSYLKDKEEKLAKRNDDIAEIKKQFGSNFAGEEFWVDIEKNINSQLACPWTDKEYDKLREELFYYALRLHKAFILNSKSVKQNINCLINMWWNKFSIQNRRDAYAHLINTLFFIVPVISTTFASVSTLLKYIGKEELGTLIIDEAGQATPQSALGAMWRTCKSIVIGDPMQIEPIVTVPDIFYEKFAAELNIDKAYISKTVSVQNFADKANRYGGYLVCGDNNVWAGCPLLVHRRCIDPMFSISNEIAYNGRMLKETKEPDKNIQLIFNKSEWLNIGGRENGNKDHYVKEQGEMVAQIVLDAMKLDGKLPNLFIISPFKSVIYNMKKTLRESIKENYKQYNDDDINQWLERSCGTIHTFQGREENEAIIILGCDGRSEAAARWAGSKPNILNVAVTRAKYRVVFIGNHELWEKIPYFGKAYKILSEYTKEQYNKDQ